MHKGGKWKDVPELKGAVEINMHFPKTRQELAHLLQTTEILYSYDDCSALLDEAYFCGAKVKLITKDGFKDYSPETFFDPALLDEQLKTFFEITQKMDYKGEIEAFYLPDNLKQAVRKVRLYSILFSLTKIKLFETKKQKFEDLCTNSMLTM